MVRQPSIHESQEPAMINLRPKLGVLMEYFTCVIICCVCPSLSRRTGRSLLDGAESPAALPAASCCAGLARQPRSHWVGHAQWVMQPRWLRCPDLHCTAGLFCSIPKLCSLTSYELATTVQELERSRDVENRPPLERIAAEMIQARPPSRLPACAPF